MNKLVIKDKNIITTLKREDVNDKLQRFERIQDYKRDLRQSSIKQRMQRLDEMK